MTRPPSNAPPPPTPGERLLHLASPHKHHHVPAPDNLASRLSSA